MKRILSVIVVFLAGALAAWPAASPVLTTVSAIRALTSGEASRELPAVVEGTVTYYDSDRVLFIEEGDSAIYVQTKPEQNLLPGDRVLVRGKTHMDFRPDVYSDEVKLLGHGSLPPALPVDFGKLIRTEHDCMLVSVRATVRSADIVTDGQLPRIFLELLTDGGYVTATVIKPDASALKSLLDAQVEITGVATGRSDSKGQLTGIVLAVPSLQEVKILKPAGTSPDLLPLTPMDEVLQGSYVRDSTSRVRIQGTITYYQPGSAVVLQNGAKSLWIATHTEMPLRIGYLANATGFPDVHNNDLALTRGDITELGTAAPIAPVRLNWEKLASGTNTFNLVSIEGRLLAAIRESEQDEYFLVSDGHLLSAVYRHPYERMGLPLPAMKQVAVGAKVRLTGICVPYYGSNPYQGPLAFSILLRTFDDVAVVGQPSWLTVRNLSYLIVLLLLIVLLVGGQAWNIERKARRQTAALANIEHRRSHILEDINGFKPLAETIEKITELASLSLHGAPCWCQLSDGAKFGNFPRKLSTLRVIQAEITAHTGPSLGTVFAALNPQLKPTAEEAEALSMAVGLATLAIETRRLYTDLRRRSEFDQLTDIHNRASLDSRLEALLEEASEQGAVFGLVYIDLDEFKLVNDRYGHHVGDHYLQEAASRMKHQLRSNDMLARLGGDEFAALLQVVRNRADVEEVAHRLEHCFDNPMSIDGSLLRGSVSVGIALYPDDGTTGDSLLTAADTAMYKVKNSKRPAQGSPATRTPEI